MARLIRRLLSIALVALLLSACNIDGQASCSCAAGITYQGTFYGQYSDITVPTDAQIGKSDKVTGCCGDAQPVVAVYSIDGIDPELAVATKYSDGTASFNVASDLTLQESRLVKQFAKDHEDPVRQ